MSKEPPKHPPDDDGIISLEEILAEYETTPFDTQELLHLMKQDDAPPPENIIAFPAEPEPAEELPKSKNPITRKLEEKLRTVRQKTDQHAAHMYEHAAEEYDTQNLLAEELLPAVDLEDEEEIEKAEMRRPRRKPEAPPPDTDPKKLTDYYARGLSFFRLRTVLVFVLTALQTAVAYYSGARFLFTDAAGHRMMSYLCAALLVFAMVLSFDRLLYGLGKLISARPVPESLLLMACVATLFDALTLPLMTARSGQLPYTAVCTAALAFYMFGAYRKRQGQRLACRMAAVVKEPYRVTLDELVWNGKDAFSKHRGGTEDFGSQIQRSDGTERMLRSVIPLLLIACLLGAVVVSVGQGHPEHLLWALSAALCAATPFYGALLYGSPYYHITRQMGKSGATLAGWESAETTGRGDGILLTDGDLFPPGMIEPNGVKTFGRMTAETAMMYTHALLEEAGSSLAKTFSDLLRRHGCSPKQAFKLAVHDGDGLSAYVKDDHVLVGSSSFMKIMRVDVPDGLKVKTAVYCAINGQLAAVFALHYAMHGNIHDGIVDLVREHLTPIFATRDFNIMPDMLETRWHLPVHKMQFPAYRRRMELSNPQRSHTGSLTALLAREGLAPYYAAVSGARRLRRAVRNGTRLAVLGTIVGLLFVFYLTWHGSYASLSSLNLLIFLSLWMAPNLFARMILNLDV